MKQHIHPNDFNEKVFQLIDKDWMLITAGNPRENNTMTASYGSFGILFGKPVAHVYVRPERYTYRFLEKYPGFSLSFFDDKYRPQLQYCGRTSGSKEDKIKKCGFTTCFSAEEIPYFEEARLTVFCKTVYKQDLDTTLLLNEKIKNDIYSSGGIHRMYVGEITDILYQK